MWPAIYRIQGSKVRCISLRHNPIPASVCGERGPTCSEHRRPNETVVRGQKASTGLCIAKANGISGVLYAPSAVHGACALQFLVFLRRADRIHPVFDLELLSEKNYSNSIGCQ